MSFNFKFLIVKVCLGIVLISFVGVFIYHVVSGMT